MFLQPVIVLLGSILVSWQINAGVSSPGRSYTSRCETELWISYHSWWQAPSPGCSAAGYVGSPPPAGTTRRERQRRPSHTHWGGEERRKEKGRNEKTRLIFYVYKEACNKALLLLWVFSYMLSSSDTLASIFDVQLTAGHVGFPPNLTSWVSWQCRWWGVFIWFTGNWAILKAPIK